MEKTLVKEKIHRKKVKRNGSGQGSIDKWFLIAILALLCIGITMIYSASSYYALYENGSTTYFLAKIAIWSIVGVVCMFLTMSLDYHIYRNRKFVWFIYFLSMVLLIIALFSGSINGANRWIRLGQLSFQPSEIAKYAVVLAVALNIDMGKKKIRNLWRGPIGNLVIATGLAIFILAGKNLSITAVVFVVAFIMVFVGGAKKKHTLPIIPLGAIIGFILIYTSDYRWDRFTSFLDPWKDSTGKSYQLIQSLYALGSGGVFGVGLGQSRQKMLFIPEPHNDFIFAIIGEELGLIGCVLIILIFMFVIIRGIQIAIKAKDNFGFLIAVGIVSIVALQAIINIAVVTGSMPVTGVPLPFISYGGTALVVNLAAIGILLNISRQKKDIKTSMSKKI